MECIAYELKLLLEVHVMTDLIFFLSEFLNRHINVETHYDSLDPFEYVHPLIVKTHWQGKHFHPLVLMKLHAKN